MGVSTVIPGWFLKMFWGCFKGVLQMFQGCFKSISRVFYGCFKENLSAIKGCFKHVSSVLLMCISVGLYNSVFEIFRWRKRTRIIATLSSILDSQLSWESSKFQLTRWSYRVVLLLSGTAWPAGWLNVWGHVSQFSLDFSAVSPP